MSARTPDYLSLPMTSSRYRSQAATTSMSYAAQKQPRQAWRHSASRHNARVVMLFIFAHAAAHGGQTSGRRVAVACSTEQNGGSKRGGQLHNGRRMKQ